MSGYGREHPGATVVWEHSIGEDRVLRVQFPLVAGRGESLDWRVEADFSQKRAWHPVAWATWSGDQSVLKKDLRWEWKTVGESQIPQRYALRTYDFTNKYGFGSQQVVIERVFELMDVHVNERIDERTLSWRRFDLGPGDRIMDRPTRVLQVLNAKGEPVPVDRQARQLDPLQEPLPAAGYFWLTVTNLLVIGGVLIVVFIHRRCRRTE
jgi:hypothetical protein